MAVETTKIIEHEHLVGLYTMFYIHGSNHLQHKNFRFHGSLKEARERAQIHCDIMNFRLKHVQPLICDLKKEEGFFLGTPEAMNATQPKV